MKKIIPFDFERMLLGEAPPEFLIEVFFRGLLLYLYMLFIMRLLGKRMAGELTVTEMVLMVTLGGSVAVAIQVPEGGALIGFVVLSCALIFERSVGWLTTKSKKADKLIEGKSKLLIRDGVLQTRCMKEVKVTREQIFAALRQKQIYQLGAIERLYLEAGGTFSLYKKEKNTPPGLAIFPDDDEEMKNKREKDGNIKVCVCCGEKQTNHQHCNQCEGTEFEAAIK